MGKWGLFSALRYLGDRDRGPRTIRADGLPLQRPLRVWTETVRQEARRQRWARRQPLWPRAVGWGFVCMALIAAVKAEYPLPRPTPAELSAGGVRSLVAIATGLPAGVHEGVPAEFGWSTTAPGPFTLVVFDAAYREIARREDLAGTHFATPSDWRELLAAAGTFHWQVFTTAAGQPLRSLCEQVEIR